MFDKLEPKYDVLIIGGKVNGFLIIEFSRLLSPEVMKDLLAINSYPGFMIHSILPGSLIYHLFYPLAYKQSDVVKAIYDCLATQHALTIEYKAN